MFLGVLDLFLFSIFICFLAFFKLKFYVGVIDLFRLDGDGKVSLSFNKSATFLNWGEDFLLDAEILWGLWEPIILTDFDSLLDEKCFDFWFLVAKIGPFLLKVTRN
mgnify:CR=1 FL=1